MNHLIKNLTVHALNLTCLRKSKQQHNKDIKHYMACKMRHLITNLAVPKLNLTYLREIKQQLNEKAQQRSIHPDYLLLDPPLLMVALFFLTHATHFMSFGVI
jgi:hypothetical protein